MPRHLHPLGAPASCGPDGAPRWGKPWWARRTSCRAGGLRCPLWRCQRGGCVVPFGGAAAWQLGAGKAASGSGGIGAGVVTRAPCLRWLRAAHAARPGARRAGWAPCPCGARVTAPAAPAAAPLEVAARRASASCLARAARR